MSYTSRPILFLCFLSVLVSCVPLPIFNNSIVQMARISARMNLQTEMTIGQSYTSAKRIVVQPLGNMTQPTQVMVAFVNDSQFQWYLFDQSDNFNSSISNNEARSLPGDPQNFLLNEGFSKIIYAEKGSNQIKALTMNSFTVFQDLELSNNVSGMFLFVGKSRLDQQFKRNLFLFVNSGIKGEGRLSSSQNPDNFVAYIDFAQGIGPWDTNTQNFAYNPFLGKGFLRVGSQTFSFPVPTNDSGQSVGLITTGPSLIPGNDLLFLTLLSVNNRLLFYTNEKYVVFDQTGQNEEFSFFHGNILVFLREVYEGSTSYCQFAMIFSDQNSSTIVRIYSIPTSDLSKLQ